MKVSLPFDQRNRTIRQRFRDLVIGDLPRIANDNRSKAEVLAVFGDGSRELMEPLNLVAKHLTSEFEISEVAESRRFTSLVDHLITVSGEMEHRIKELLEG